MSLRKCIDCGIKATNILEVNKFTKGGNRDKYNRRNLCKECIKKIRRYVTA